jgi:DNA-binding response OmpR family regulator
MKHSRTILVVDDDPRSLGLLTGILSTEGYRVRPADSGELALASIEAKPPALILLDIRMPGVDGFEVCCRLKMREETRDIPIVFLSAASEVEERVEGLRLGAVDFMSKPFSRDELLARVQIHLELATLRADLERQVADRTADLRAANRRLEEELAERRRMDQALSESEERFRTLADRARVVTGKAADIASRSTTNAP